MTTVVNEGKLVKNNKKEVTILEKSPTQSMRLELNSILKKEEFKNGINFNNLWDELEKNTELKEMMYNEEGKKRLGLLQGLTNRINLNKEKNIQIIKKGTESLFVYFSSDLDYLFKTTSFYLKTSSELDFSVVTKGLTATDKKVFLSFEKHWKDLEKTNKALEKLTEKIYDKL